MKRSSDEFRDEREESEGPEEERAVRAGEVCRRACEESGVKVASWHHFEAWKEFVEGEIGDSQLNDKAKHEMDRFSVV